MKTSEKKKTEIRMEPEFYDKIRDLVYERKYRSLNDAYETLLKAGYSVLHEK